MKLRRDLLVICTRNREAELSQAISAVRRADPRVHCLIVDSSDQHIYEHNARLLANYDHVVQMPHEPSLARQRNSAIRYARSQGYALVHFIDDDAVVHQNYFNAMRHAFEDSELAGAGGVVINQDRPRMVLVKRLFALYSARPGVVMRSGRNTIGHFPESPAVQPDWLPGCCMSYNLERVSILFDSRKEGYSLSEDLDFSFRLSRAEKLRIVKDALVEHKESPVNRADAAELARQRTTVTYEWVRENREHGLSLPLFIYSAVGEILLRLGSGITRGDPAEIRWARGVSRGLADIWMTRRKG